MREKKSVKERERKIGKRDTENIVKTLHSD